MLRLTFYTAPVSVGILLPFFMMTELRKLMAYGCAPIGNHLPSCHPTYSESMPAGKLSCP